MALHRPLTVALAASCALMLLTWAPHYLTWPWWADVDQFAVSALSWRAGLVPFRDQADFDFPGPIYLLYLLGLIFGWDHTAPFYAADAAMVVGLGIALAALEPPPLRPDAARDWSPTCRSSATTWASATPWSRSATGTGRSSRPWR